tara:strand:+ start:1945 stop:2352 length:408 start_codon:yes stop_codon:yes gene_type:complete
MDDLFKLDIKSVEGTLFSDDVLFLRINTSSGDMGIQAGHTFTISNIVEGVLEYSITEDKVEFLYISGGIAIVKPNHVLLSVDYVKKPTDFDAKELKDTIKLSSQNYKESTNYDSKMESLHLLNTAENKLKVAQSV